MSPVTPPDAQGSSTRPYLIRALHDWCTDNGFTPYLAVHVDQGVQVPMEYVKNNEIVLNVGFEATSSLKLGNEFVEFKARFGGVAREIVVPVDHVVAIYARENGQGMAFPMPLSAGGEPGAQATTLGGPPTAPPAAERPGRGLRLASVDKPATGPVALKSVGETSTDSGEGGASASLPDASSGSGESEDPPPNAPRPTLKRIK